MSNKPSVAKGAFNITRIIAATTIEILAALALDGWLSWALWAVAAWNVVVMVLIVIGGLGLAVEAEKQKQKVNVTLTGDTSQFEQAMRRTSEAARRIGGES